MKGICSMDALARVEAFSIPEPFSGCWLWLGSLSGNGYGAIQYRGRQIVAHKLSYEAHIGAVPAGLELDHTCRLRCCVNPRHLEPVTHKVNLNRSSLIGRGAGTAQTAKTHCPQGHEYTPENTRVGRGKRYCKTCHRDRERVKYQNEKELYL